MPRSRAFWSDEKTNLLKTLLREGYTYKQISSKMGISKNALIGRVHRIKAAYPAGEKRNGGQKKPEKITSLKRKSRNWSFLTESSREFIEYVDSRSSLIVDWTKEPPSLYVPFNKLESCQCRYIHGDPKKNTHHYCGHMQSGLGPYCEFHAAVCFSSKRWQTKDVRAKPEVAKTKRV